MVVKSKKKNAGREKKIKVLSLKKETVKNLSGGESKRIKGGLGLAGPSRRSQPQPLSG